MLLAHPEVVVADWAAVSNESGLTYDAMHLTSSGIRLGTPATTSRGFGEAEMRTIGRIIVEAIRTRDDADAQAGLANEVSAIAARFPVPGLSRA